MTVKKLGRYELLEQLGEGGMGAVWLARLSGTAGFEKLCIVKTVLPSIATDAEFVSRFLHEGRVLTQLSHGNIAQVLDMNEADGQLFIALEYVAGVDLARLHAQVRAANQFMPPALVVALIAQAAEGLGSAHRKHALDGTPLNIVHRDVSPQNIMVSYEGEVKVIDFGIARSEARSRNTTQASVMGKLGYMAPEQARGEPVDHRADQYALGIVLWELLSNIAFVPRGTLTEMVAAMAMPTIRPLSPLRPDVPASLEAVVLKSLAPLPDARFPDTDAFAQALNAELLALGAPPTKPQLGAYVRAACEPQYKSQQVLLSRVSTIRGLPAVTPTDAELAATALRVATTPVMGTDSTSKLATPTVETALPTAPARPSQLRKAEPLELAAAASTPLTTGELAAASGMKRSPVVPILIAAVVVLVLAVAVALSFKTREEPPVVVVDAGVVVVPPPLPPPQPPPLEVVDSGIAVVVAPPPVEEEPTLRLAARRAGNNTWIVSNRNRTQWTRCELTVPGQRVFSIGSVLGGSSREISDAQLRVSSSARVLTRQLRVDCDQGYGLVDLR